MKLQDLAKRTISGYSPNPSMNFLFFMFILTFNFFIKKLN